MIGTQSMDTKIGKYKMRCILEDPWILRCDFKLFQDMVLEWYLFSISYSIYFHIAVLLKFRPSVYHVEHPPRQNFEWLAWGLRNIHPDWYPDGPVESVDSEFRFWCSVLLLTGFDPCWRLRCLLVWGASRGRFRQWAGQNISLIGRNLMQTISVILFKWRGFDHPRVWETK
jgi:hypothetical protein